MTWTVESLAAHYEALREADARFDQERDRRYFEVARERERALTIETEARNEALRLARDIQTYKDEKANELRSQIESERGIYATKDDLAVAADKMIATIKPALDYATSQQGSSAGVQKLTTNMFALLGAVATIAALIGHFVH